MPPVGLDSVLAQELLSTSSAGGGWGYQPGHDARLEPTCWALLALTASRLSSPEVSNAVTQGFEFLARCQRADGWLVENARWPVNIAFNGLAAFTWLNRLHNTADDRVQRLLSTLAASKGLKIPQSPSFAQDNSLQGWAWIDGTFSWVEPTAWGTLALKKAMGARLAVDTVARARVEEADRLLIDRCGRSGGWNYGNPNVLGQDLYSHAPTTALALLALQNRRDHPAVERSLAFLESHWKNETSLLAMGLSLICLRVYDRTGASVDTRLREDLTRRQHSLRQNSPARTNVAMLGGVHGLAVAITAVQMDSDDATFRF